MTETITELMQMPSDVSELFKSLLECFAVLMYDRTSDTMVVNETRKLFLTQKSRALENIPSTKAVAILSQPCQLYAKLSSSMSI